VYKIDVSANQYKINLPLLITCTDWTDCTECRQTTVVPPTRRSIDSRRSRRPCSGRFASLELSIPLTIPSLLLLPVFKRQLNCAVSRCYDC